MNFVKLFTISSDDRRDYYKKKISEHTPPVNEHDREMIRMYQRFLDVNKMDNVLITHH
ncbi:hypothetical protein [Candidatus Thiodiazotropha sp. CDECU1]|uniref:hypothetical protein n=1 Tax=Candidatus Thiodiazotropha sp. CDECU1 TaxID=3065865 RepID=UPI00292D06EF|nr:hypothetical protein [Candidatus Thiodiazotropha sp. CDECU1]